jgi:N-acetylneuraminate synthase
MVSGNYGMKYIFQQEWPPRMKRWFSDFFVSKGRNKDLVFLQLLPPVIQCTISDVCLLDINLFKQKSMRGQGKSTLVFRTLRNSCRCCGSYTLERANIPKRHYNLRQNMERTRSQPSLEPMGLRKLSRDLIVVHAVLTFKATILPIEQVQREKLKN